MCSESWLINEAVRKNFAGMSFLHNSIPIQVESIVFPVPVPPYMRMFFPWSLNSSAFRLCTEQPDWNSTSSSRNWEKSYGFGNPAALTRFRIRLSRRYLISSFRSWHRNSWLLPPSVVIARSARFDDKRNCLQHAAISSWKELLMRNTPFQEMCHTHPDQPASAQAPAHLPAP